MPLYITSGYRCPKHPIEAAKVAEGKKPGNHAEGIAADVRTNSLTPMELYRSAFTIPAFTGFGVDRQQAYVHLDVRLATRAHWMYLNGKEVRWNP